MRKILFALLIGSAAIFTLSLRVDAQTINEVWESTKDTNSVAILETFIKIYPNSIYAELAKARIKELRAQSSKKATPEIVRRPASTLSPLGPETSAPAQTPPAKAPPATVEAPSPKAEPQPAGPPKVEPSTAKVEAPSSAGELYHRVFDNDPDLIRAIQEELKRHHCYTGDVDGIWGKGSRKAVADFNHYSRATVSDKPSEALFTAVSASANPVCPLVCGPRFVAKNGRCVLKTCPPGRSLSERGACLASAPKRR